MLLSSSIALLASNSTLFDTFVFCYITESLKMSSLLLFLASPMDLRGNVHSARKKITDTGISELAV